MNETNIIITLSLVGFIITFLCSSKTVKEWWEKHVVGDAADYTNSEECFDCNRGDCCGCVHSNVTSAYLIKYQYDKAAANATCTIRDGIVVAQDPVGGDDLWQITNFVGCRKEALQQWADRATPIEPRTVTFS